MDFSHHQSMTRLEPEGGSGFSEDVKPKGASGPISRFLDQAFYWYTLKNDPLHQTWINMEIGGVFTK